MSSPGPPRTPTNVLKLRGSWRGKQREKTEPKPRKGRPRCPDHFNVFQRSAWKWLTVVLEDMGTLTKADRGVMERYCTEFVRWRKCHAHIEKHGESYAVKMYPKDTHGRLDESRAGKVVGAKMFPESKLALQLNGVLGQLEGKLGLSPADRARIEIPETKDADSSKARFIRTG